MQVKYYLKRPDAPDKTAIYARISYNGEQLKYYIDKNINPQHWNAKTHRARETKAFPQHPEFNKRLDNIAATIEAEIDKYLNKHKQVPKPEQLRDILDIAVKHKPDLSKPTFFQYFNDFIERSKNGTRLHMKTRKPITAGTIRNYNTTFKFLSSFEKETGQTVDFDTITTALYDKLLKYANNLVIGKRKDGSKIVGLSAGYTGKHIRCIKTVLTDATDNGKNTNLDFKKKSFAIIEEQADTIALNEVELQKLVKLDLSDNKPLEQVRDLFVIGCFTGLRFSDFSTFNPDNIHGGKITVKQTKTGHKIVIPIHTNVKAIIEKYNGVLPTAISNQKTNAALKKIAKLIPEMHRQETIKQTRGGAVVSQQLPRYELISSHTGRRTFATNEYKLGTPTITIRAITGHKSEATFLKYIKATNDEHADKLSIVWQEREKNGNKSIAL
jgi:integrase